MKKKGLLQNDIWQSFFIQAMRFVSLVNPIHNEIVYICDQNYQQFLFIHLRLKSWLK